MKDKPRREAIGMSRNGIGKGGRQKDEGHSKGKRQKDNG